MVMQQLPLPKHHTVFTRDAKGIGVSFRRVVGRGDRYVEIETVRGALLDFGGEDVGVFL